MSNPVDKYLQSKHAGFLRGVGEGIRAGFKDEGGRAAGRTLGLIGRDVAVGAGALALTGAAAKVFQAVTKSRDFHRMLETHPDLAEARQENPKLFNQHYNSLRSMNPAFASDPIVAGTYMRKMTLNPQVAGQVIVESLGGRPPTGLQAELGLGGGRDDDPSRPTFKLKNSL